MADGKWVMNEDDARRIDLSFDKAEQPELRSLPNHGQHLAVDDRNGNAVRRCAFCGAEELQAGFGGFGQGFGYRSFKCGICGGQTDFVYRDEVGKYFKRTAEVKEEKR